MAFAAGLLISYLALWRRIPDEIAVHFTASGRPVTSMSRSAYLLLSMAALLVVLLAGTWRLWNSDERNVARTLLRYYFAVSVMVLISVGILVYNGSS